jgi:hypothetical protein
MTEDNRKKKSTSADCTKSCRQPVCPSRASTRTAASPGRSPTGQQVATAAQIAAQHKGKPVKGEQRETAGITHAAMVEALWEKVFLGKDTKAQILLQKMAELETLE